MSDLGVIVASLVGVYALATGCYLVLENRRPQASLAWMLAFVFAPGIGLAVYLLFGRSNKAFSRQTQLLKQDLRGHAKPLLAPILARADAEMTRVAGHGFGHRKLVMLIRRNADSALTVANQVAIQQDASTFYPSLLADMRAARHSIHLQYFIWGADEKTEPLMQAMMDKARADVEVRLLYDPLGSQAHFPQRAIRTLQQAGVKVAATSPLYRLHTISYRNHRKITVIDGTIGYTGGMNIGGEHLDGGSGFDSWRDTQVRIVGEAAAVLQAVFMVDWYNAVRENLFQPRYFPG